MREKIWEKSRAFVGCFFLLSIVISTNKTEAAVQDTNEGTLNVQWEDENLGESICNALKKEEVTYADIEGITGITDKWIKQTSTLKYYRNTTSNRKKHMKM